MSYDSVILADSPVGYWKLDETSGTTAVDSSGNGYNGTYGTNVQIGATSLNEVISSNSPIFDGINDKVVIAYNAAFATTPLSIELWITPWGGSYTNQQHIFSCAQSGGYYISISSDGLSIVGGVYVGGAYREVSYTPSPLPEKLFHCVMTYSGRYLKLYINDSLVDSYDHGSNVNITYAYNNSRMIGSNPNTTTGADPDYWYRGKVNNVAYYNTELSAAQVEAHYVAGFLYLAGTITESFAVTDWLLTASKVSTGEEVGSIVVTGGTYSIPCLTPKLCNIHISPKITGVWEASKVVSLDEVYTPSNPNTVPRLFKVTTAGTFDTTEVSWPVSGTVTQGTAVLTFIDDLDDAMFKTIGCKFPS